MTVKDRVVEWMKQLAEIWGSYLNEVVSHWDGAPIELLCFGETRGILCDNITEIYKEIQVTRSDSRRVRFTWMKTDHGTYRLHISPMTMLIDRGSEGGGSCIASYSSYPFNGLVTTSFPSVCDQPGKNPLKYPAWPGTKTGPRRKQTARYIHSPTELSWLYRLMETGPSKILPSTVYNT